MNLELELLKRVKDNTVKRMVDEFGEIAEKLTERKLSIWDARCIIYEEVKKQAESIIDRDKRKAMEEFR